MIGRVTTNMIYNTMTGSLQSNLQNLMDLQRQIATQSKYSKLSDNPSEIARALSLQSSISANEQYIKNQEDAVTMLKLTETQLNNALDIVQTIREKVIYAGDGALDSTAVEAIALEIEGLQDELLDTLNAKVAGKYIFGGTNTTTKPFVKDASGQVRYLGSDENIRYMIEDGLLGEVGFSGSELMSSDYTSYFVCSHHVPMEWEWTGREEKVQIQVGNRTLSVFIPEQWIDEVATGKTKPTDYNQFRDPDEVSGISMDDLAMLVNRALTEQGTDMLVTATVEKDYGANQQRLIFNSNTGEPISVTGWSTTDPQPMAQAMSGLLWGPSMAQGEGPADIAGLAGKSLTFTYTGLSQASKAAFLRETTLTATHLNDFFTKYGAAEQTAENLAKWLNETSLAGTDPLNTSDVSPLLPDGLIAVANDDGSLSFTFGYGNVSGGGFEISGSGADALMGGTAGTYVSGEEPPAGYWNQTMIEGSLKPDFSAMTGSFSVYVDGVQKGTTIDLSTYDGEEDGGSLAAWMNDHLPSDVLASVSHTGKIILTSISGGKINLDGTGVTPVMGKPDVSAVPEYSGLTGSVNTLGWKGDTLGKEITISRDDGKSWTFKLDEYKNITELVNKINVTMQVKSGEQPVASLASGRLVLQSSSGALEVKDAATGKAGGTAQLFGAEYAGGIKSSTSSLTLKLGSAQDVKIFINEGDDLSRIADRLNAIEGIYARTSADYAQLVVVAQRTGSDPADPLAANSAQEKSHYPSFTIWGEGMAMTLFDFEYSVDEGTEIERGVAASTEQTRPIDHSHIDVFDYLGMETALKSREYELGETLAVGRRLTNPEEAYNAETNPYIYDGEELHWRIISGTHVTDLKLGPGEYTMEQIAERLKNAGPGWLEVTVDVFRPEGVNADDSEDGLNNEGGSPTSANKEDATSRLVIRSLDGSPVSFMDINNQRYAEEIGLSSAVRSDENTGLDNVRFPDAPCLDPNLPAMLRVQMTCGMQYDITLTRADVVDKATGYVDRKKVMDQIAKQVNAQAGREVMRVVVPVNSSGKAIPNSASLVAVSGEPFEVVDLPVLDPNWSTGNNIYSAGIAAQMGIHGGVSSIPAMTDQDTIGGVGGKAGTIRFETLGHSVEIDVTEDDTAKTIMDRLRSQAGDWLYVNFYDEDMSYMVENDPIISIAAKDGSAVNIIDVKGSAAQDQLLLNTSIQGSAPLGVKGTDGAWQWFDLSGGSSAGVGYTFSVTVAGYTHTIDMYQSEAGALSAMRDINGNGYADAEDLVATINSRMQDDDVKAELNEDGRLVIWSPRGYSVSLESTMTGPAITRDSGDTAIYSEGTFEATENIGMADYPIYQGPLVGAAHVADSAGAGAPKLPSNGQTYVDVGSTGTSATAPTVYTYNASTLEWDAETASSGTVPPTGAGAAGAKYIDTASGKFYTWNTTVSAWVPSVPNSYGAGLPAPADAGKWEADNIPPDGYTYLDSDTGDIYTYNYDDHKWDMDTMNDGDVCGVVGSTQVYYKNAAELIDLSDGDNAVLQGNNIMTFQYDKWVSVSGLGLAAGTGGVSESTPYRGGYGLDDPDRTAPGIYTQNVVMRGGANQTKQNFFGVLDNITSAIRAENRDGLSEKLLPVIDKFIDSLLKAISTGGALQARYEGNVSRMNLTGIALTEEHDNIAGVDLTQLSTELMLAQSVYQASLGVMSYLIQPTLLDYLR